MKVSLLFFILCLYACGPSAEEKAKIETQRDADSIAAATRAADSLNVIEKSMEPPKSEIANRHCCSDHNPQHCGETKAELKALTEKFQCTGFN